MAGGPGIELVQYQIRLGIKIGHNTNFVVWMRIELDVGISEGCQAWGRRDEGASERRSSSPKSVGGEGRELVADDSGGRGALGGKSVVA